MYLWRRTKEFLYPLKLFYRAVFAYPSKRIPENSEDTYNEYWKKKRKSTVGALTQWQKERADIILRTLFSRKEGGEVTFADIGCGNGAIGAYLQSHISRSAVVGYDSSKTALEEARGNGVEAVLCDVARAEEYTRFREMDYYLLLEVLEHLPKAEKLFAVSRQKARRGVFFSVPNSGYISYRLRLLFGKFPAQWLITHDEHVRFWTVADMRWWLLAQGISDFEIFCYRGVPILNKIWPSLFSAGLVVFVPKHQNNCVREEKKSDML